MRHAILIFLAVLALSGLVGAVHAADDLASCNTFTELERDECLANAINMQPDLVARCKEVGNVDIRDRCYDYAATKLDDPSWCNKVTGDPGFGCVMLRAEHTKDYAICDTLKPGAAGARDFWDKKAACFNTVRDLRGDKDRPEIGPYIDPCETEAKAHLENYLAIWRRLFAARHGLSDSDANARIHVDDPSIICGRDGTTLHVIFTVTTDWLRIKHYDLLPMKLSDQVRVAPVFQNHLLSEDELKRLADTPAYHPEKLNLSDRLAYRFQFIAEAALKTKMNGSDPHLSYAYMRLNKPYGTPAEPYMEIRTTKDQAKNICPVGYLNLLSGETEIRDDACMVN